jgi:hypothetical protein
VTDLWIPADRLLSVAALHTNPSQALAGLSVERTFRELKNGRRSYVSLRVADSILTRLNLHHHWHTSKDHGGLADIYEDGQQYGAPDSTPSRPGPNQIRYATREEALEARRQTWRESKRRNK